jgi:hypothetical protein
MRSGAILSLIFLFSTASAWAQDSGDSAAPSYPPNRIETSPTPPPGRVGIVAAPTPARTAGNSSLSPDNSSQMGAGFQIHFGGGKKTLEQEKQLEQQEDND